jgi:hypothetical protein
MLRNKVKSAEREIGYMAMEGWISASEEAFFLQFETMYAFTRQYSID